MIVAVSKYSAAALVAATVIIAGESSIFLPPQFETVDDVPSRYFIEDRVVYGRVERAIDGDTVRIRHCRYSFYCEDRMKKVTSLGGSRLISLEPPKRIYDSTLSIRLYGVDYKREKMIHLPSRLVTWQRSIFLIQYWEKK
jgi:endonuclease YncB( thermonuclease family)